MYKNIGKKIKVLAKIIFCIEAVLFVVIGLAALASDAVAGVFLLLLGPVFAWASSWILYGFGELIENVKEIAERMPNKKPPVTKEYKDYYDNDDLA